MQTANGIKKRANDAVGKFLTSEKLRCLREAERLVGTLSGRERSVLEFGFASGMMAVKQADKTIKGVFQK